MLFTLHIGDREVALKQQKRHVLKIEFSMQRHIHTHKNLTYLNMGDVEKLGPSTLNQAEKNNQNTKQNLVQKQTCAALRSHLQMLKQR